MAMELPVTIFTSGVLGVLFVLLSVRVSSARAKTKVLVGDGSDQPGTGKLLAAIRAQGSFAEYVPLALILLALTEFIGSPHWLSAGAAASLILARIIHPIGMHRPAPNVFRFVGAVLTWLVILALSVGLLIGAAASWH